MHRPTLAMTLAVTVAAGALIPVGALGAATAKPVKKTVRVQDNFFSPPKLTITKGSTVTWVWPTEVGDTHDVTLIKKPTGAKFTFVDGDTGKRVTKTTFQSTPFAAGSAKFVVKGFTKPGKYRIVCTFHETEMTLDITVKK